MEQVAIITGGGSGIGRAIALRFARSGYSVVVNDINREAGEKVLSEIEAEDGKDLFIDADVGDELQVSNMFKVIKEKFGKIDVLVNNAGNPGPFSLVVDMPTETWHKTISVHLNGPFYCLREAARIMIAGGHGRIINIASIAGIMGTVGSAEYGAAKAGMINLTRSSAKELGPHRITVNAINPGLVSTPTNLKLKEKGSHFIDSSVKGMPTGRMTSPEEIAELVLFLSSPAAGNINGQVIAVDGGAAITTNLDLYMSSYLARKKSRGG